MLLFILGFLLSWLIILVSGYLFSLVVCEHSDLRLVLAVSFGSGINAIIMSVLGFLYNFRLTTVIAAYSGLLIILLFFNKKRLSKIGIRFKAPAKKSYFVFLIIVPFIFSSVFHILFFPELYNDSMIYAQWAKIMFQEKRIGIAEGGPAFVAGYPSAFQLLGVFGYLFTGESIVLLRLNSLIFSCFLMMLLYHYTKEIFKKPEYQLLSILIFITLPFTIFFSRSASQYVYLVFQFSLALYFLHRFFLAKNKKDLYQASIFGGSSALTSYLGILFLPLLFLTLQFDRKYYKHILISLLVFSLVASPWYLRNLVVFNNPLWPFGGGRYILPARISDFYVQLERVSKSAGFSYGSYEEFYLSTKRLFLSYVDYSDATNYQGLNPAFTLFVIPGLVYWLVKRNKKSEFFIFSFLIILIFYFLVANFFTKYLVLISIPTVFIAIYFIKFLQEFKVIKWALVLFFVFLYINSLYLALFWDECPIGGIEYPKILEYLSDHKKILEICYGGNAKLWNWVDDNIPDNETIATNDIRLYYYNKEVIEFASWKLRELYYLMDIDESVGALKENGVGYVAVVAGATNQIEKYPQYFELVKEIDGGAVYKVV